MSCQDRVNQGLDPANVLWSAASTFQVAEHRAEQDTAKLDTRRLTLASQKGGTDRGLLHAVGGRCSGLRPSPEVAGRLPRYPSVSAARIGRLAIDRRFHRRGLGGALLLNAAMRALRSEIVVFVLVVDAKDDKAATFDRHHGFTSFASSPLQRIAPIETFRKLLC